MPSHKIHRLFNKALLGEEYEDINKFCDLVKGRNHRKKWGHDIYTPLLVYILTNDKKKSCASALHIMLDEVM
ncbi:MAG: hypothetical protein QXJ25_02280 [Candidatus Aenigmatarchaeota archaeon]